MSSYRYAVIGGGIAGLASALELAKCAGGANVVLVEASGRLGGVVSTEMYDGYVIERGPDGVLSRKPETLELIRELGIENRVVGRRADHPGAYLRSANRLRRFPAGLTGMVPLDLESLRESEILSEEGLARVEREPEIPQGAGAPGGDGSAGDRSAAHEASGGAPGGDESVASFFSRRFGGELFQRLVAPLVSGIYAGSGDELSMSALFPQLIELEREYGSVIEGMRARRTAVDGPTGSGDRSGRRDRLVPGESGSEHPERGGGDPRHGDRAERTPRAGFISLAGGMGKLVQACRTELERRGVAIRTGYQALAIVSESGGYRIELGRGPGASDDRTEARRDTGSAASSIYADRVVAAVSANALAGIVRGGSEEPDRRLLEGELNGIEMRSAALVTLAVPERTLSVLPPGAGYVVAGGGPAPGRSRRPQDEETGPAPSGAAQRSPSHELLACTIASRKWPGRAPPGRELIRFFFRRHRGGAVDARERSRLVELALAELSDVLDRADPAGDAITGSAGRGGGDSADAAERFRTEHHSVEPELSRVVVHRDVSPVYRVGHLDRVTSIRRALADSLPGVSIAGSSYDGVGIPDCIASGRRAAAEALER